MRTSLGYRQGNDLARDVCGLFSFGGLASAPDEGAGKRQSDRARTATVEGCSISVSMRDSTAATGGHA